MPEEEREQDIITREYSTPTPPSPVEDVFNRLEGMPEPRARSTNRAWTTTISSGELGPPSSSAVFNQRVNPDRLLSQHLSMDYVLEEHVRSIHQEIRIVKDDMRELRDYMNHIVKMIKNLQPDIIL